MWSRRWVRKPRRLSTDDLPNDANSDSSTNHAEVACIFVSLSSVLPETVVYHSPANVSTKLVLRVPCLP